ncbi:hypothetical protein U9413_03315 [Escherichia coli]|uniref:hypothetical protein n=1 Tax=Enterobacteriaceae TaxID=543 RepID=UPI0004567575|nr:MULTISPECIES: hypothetical protein [Enterobacteriaceae]AHY11666.1 hypothetical protein CFNIH1_09140 [Citrobacter freundii CFNIH1]ELK8707833.1 hypothetical protein [Escherichia coli]AMG52745.1 hypothetical protein AL524_06415 [Citrobacter amalonaticus]MDN4291425.1 hypothetical protein [Citrobacter freundii]MDT7292090.1 hypothetical protein [Citrobacter freundii]
MKPIIGFNRHLEMDWLVQTASWSANGIHGQALKNKIDSLLAPSFDSKVAQDKTRNLLFGIWDSESKSVPKAFHSDACKLLIEHSEINIAIHWGMMLVKYPFFYNIVVQIGRMTKHEGLFIYNQLEQRITEIYGDTSTIKRCMQFVVRTLINLELLSNPKSGTYQLRKSIVIKYDNVIAWLTEVSVRAQGNSSKSMSAIINDPAWFPFDINFNENRLSSNIRLDVHHQANDAIIFL